MSEVALIDHDARSKAARALDGLAAHEKLCAERWEQARDQIKSLKGWIIWLIGLVVAGEAGLIVWLANKAFP